MGFQKKRMPLTGIILVAVKNGGKYTVAISAPLTPKIPANEEAKKIKLGIISSDIEVIRVDELLISNNLPSATRSILREHCYLNACKLLANKNATYKFACKWLTISGR